MKNRHKEADMAKNMGLSANKKGLDRESYVACMLVGVMALMCLFPFWVAVVNSFGSETQISAEGYSIIPKSFTLDNYIYLLNNKGTILLRSFKVSFLVLVLGTLYTMVVTVCYAYAIAQDKQIFPYGNMLSFFAWFTTIFSGGIIPWYILTTRYYGLSNNLFALFIPNALNVFNMFVIRNSFKAVPKELVEAARIDGASNLKVFLLIALPMSKVGVATITFFTALGYWNDFHLSLYLITKAELSTVQKMLYSMIQSVAFLVSGSESASDMTHIVLPTNTAKMVMTVLTVLPIVFIFPFAQRYFVKGITVGAVKG